MGIDKQDLPPPPGLRLVEEAVTRDEERELIALIEASGLTCPPKRTANPMWNKQFGWNYVALRESTERPDDLAHSESIERADDIPEWLNFVRDRAAALAGIAPAEMIMCNAIRYEPGSWNPPHFDKAAFVHVVGLSLGVENTMHFRKRVGDNYVHAAAVLPPRSMYHLSGEARWDYDHSLPPLDVRRWSLTFRDFSEQGLKMRVGLTQPG